MATAPAQEVPMSMPPYPSLALLASLAAISLDAAARNQPFNPEPVTQLSIVLGERVGVRAGSKEASTRLLDPETTGLLTAVFEKREQTVDQLAHEGAEVAAALAQPLAKHDVVALRELRDFALRLSSAAQTGSLEG